MSKFTKVPWTAQELMLVRDNYTKPDAFDIFKQILPARSYNQIKAQAYLMGLRRKPLYFKNDGFFSEYNPTVAAVTGFIAADGYVDLKNRRLHINVAIKDEEYLDLIKTKMGYTGRIYRSKPKEKIIIDNGTNKKYVIGKNQVSTLLIGKIDQWMEDLDKKWNIRTRKTFDLCPPPINDLRNALSYISGLIDGDGWICWNQSTQNMLSINVMGTKELMNWVKKIFDILTPGNNKSQLVKTDSPNIYVYSIRGARAIFIGKLFLQLPIHRMERKWGKARDYINLFQQQVSIDYRTKAALTKCNFDESLYTRINQEAILI